MGSTFLVLSLAAAFGNLRFWFGITHPLSTSWIVCFLFLRGISNESVRLFISELSQYLRLSLRIRFSSRPSKDPEKPLIADFAKKTIKTKEGKKLNFYFFLTKLFNDPRFYIELYVPKDIETFKYFQDR